MTSTIAKTASISAATVLEDPVHIGPNCVIQAASMGRYTFVNIGTCIFGRVVVGRFSSFARNCQVGGAEHAIHHLTTSSFGSNRRWFPDDPLAQSARRRVWTKALPPGRKARGANAIIGNDVWVGAAAIVLDGITIGDGAVIGAASVVTKNIPPYAIAAGNPAKIIRYRFDSDIISRLMAAAWWNRESEFIATLPLEDVEACLNILENQ